MLNDIYIIEYGNVDCEDIFVEAHRSPATAMTEVHQRVQDALAEYRDAGETDITKLEVNHSDDGIMNIAVTLFSGCGEEMEWWRVRQTVLFD